MSNTVAFGVGPAVAAGISAHASLDSNLVIDARRCIDQN